LGTHNEIEKQVAASDAWSQLETSYRHAQRDNPKVAGTEKRRYEGTNSAAPNSEPTYASTLPASDDPGECNPTLPDGTQLARLSDTIPCLFGPREYIEGYNVINNFNNPMITPEDEDGTPLFKRDLCGPRDSALLIVLMFAGVPAYDRSPIVFHWLSLFESGLHGDKLCCYKSNGPNEELLEIELDFQSYGTSLGEWQRSHASFNPVDNDQEAISCRGKIIDMLKERGIAAESVDQQIFMHLRDDMDPEALRTKLDRLSHDFHSSHLQGYRQHSMGRMHGHISETFDYTEPDHLLMDPNKLYTHRFSHTHPSGQLHDFKSDNVGCMFQDNRNVQKNTQTNRINLSFMGSYFKRMSCLARWSLILVCGLGVMAAVLVILYFRRGGNKKKGFTEH
jgi:hypothetical protein